MSTPTNQQLIDFVVAEANLLDELRFDDWLDLFTDDGRYWMPLAHGQTDPRLHASLMYEDKLLLKVRIARLHGGQVQLLPREGGGLRARVELPLA